MKIAVVGKGGAGKTTTSAVVARTLARSGIPVVALDGDTNPNLGLSLGLGFDETEHLVGMRQTLDAESASDDHATGWDDLLDRFGAPGPDGIRFAVVSQIDNPDPGCPCCGLSPEQLLGSVTGDAVTIVADLEAGIGTLTRLPDQAIEVLLVVVEPTPKSIEVGQRAVEVATQKGVARVVLVANRIRDDQDRTVISAAFPGVETFEVPDDLAVVTADRDGVAPLDQAPEAPAVQALSSLAKQLTPA